MIIILPFVYGSSKDVFLIIPYKASVSALKWESDDVAIYSLIVAIPKDADVETLKFVYSNQVLLLNSVMKSSCRFSSAHIYELYEMQVKQYNDSEV